MVHPPPGENDRPGIDPTEWAEVQSAARGDGQAFARLIERHQQAIGNYLWRFTRDRRQWEELVQDTFVEAYFSLQSFRGHAPWLHWLRRIATRAGYRYWTVRARAREEQERLAAWEPPGEAAKELEVAEAAALVHAVLAEMSPRDRLVLTLFYLEDCPVAEIARLAGWTQTMVKVQLHRARNRLKKRWEERGLAQ